MSEHINPEKNSDATVAVYIKPRLSELGSVAELTLGPDPEAGPDDGFAGVIS